MAYKIIDPGRAPRGLTAPPVDTQPKTQTLCCPCVASFSQSKQTKRRATHMTRAPELHSPIASLPVVIAVVVLPDLLGAVRSLAGLARCGAHDVVTRFAIRLRLLVV